MAPTLPPLSHCFKTLFLTTFFHPSEAQSFSCDPLFVPWQSRFSISNTVLNPSSLCRPQAAVISSSHLSQCNGFLSASVFLASWCLSRLLSPACTNLQQRGHCLPWGCNSVMAYLLGLLSFPNEILSSNWALQGASLPSTGRQGRPWQTGDLENMSCQLPILLSFPLALCQRNDLITGCINRNMMVRTKEVHWVNHMWSIVASSSSAHL